MVIKTLKTVILVLTASLVVAGCSTMNPEEKVNAREVYNRCPPLKKYTKEQLRQAAEEYDSLPDVSYLAVLVTDYGKMRKACRAADNFLKTMPQD